MKLIFGRQVSLIANPAVSAQIDLNIPLSQNNLHPHPKTHDLDPLHSLCHPKFSTPPATMPNNHACTRTQYQRLPARESGPLRRNVRNLRICSHCTFPDAMRHVYLVVGIRGSD